MRFNPSKPDLSLSFLTCRVHSSLDLRRIFTVRLFLSSCTQCVVISFGLLQEIGQSNVEEHLLSAPRQLVEVGFSYERVGVVAYPTCFLVQATLVFLAYVSRCILVPQVEPEPVQRTYVGQALAET